MSLTRRSSNSAPFLTESSESAPSYEDGKREYAYETYGKSTIGGGTMGEAEQCLAYLAEGIENVVKVFEDLPLGDFGNVVHCLACIVPNSCILIGEASQHRGDNDFEITRELLMRN